MDPFAELHRKLDESVAGVTPTPGAVENVIREGHRVLRRRRAAAVGVCSVLAAAAIVTPLALHRGSHQVQHVAGTSPTAAASTPVAGVMRPGIPSGGAPGPTPPVGVINAQIAAQNAFAQFLAPLGAALTAAYPNPDLSSDELSVGGDITRNGQAGDVYVRIYKDTSAVGTSSPCAALPNPPGMVPPTCTKTTEPDGSTIWSYQLASTENPTVTLNALNIRTNGQAVFVQATNYPLVGGAPLSDASGPVVLTAEQIEALALLPELLFP